MSKYFWDKLYISMWHKVRLDTEQMVKTMVKKVLKERYRDCLYCRLYIKNRVPPYELGHLENYNWTMEAVKEDVMVQTRPSEHKID